MDIVLIPASEGDKPYLLALRQQTMTSHLERQGIFLSDEAHLNRLEDHYKCSHLVFVHGNKVGTLKYLQTQDRLEIMQLQIAPEYQGQGIGRAVIQKIVAQSTHLPTHLTVLKDNPAKQLYEQLGFVTASEDKYEYHMVLPASTN
ncbi:GNAT family N-acetyltransferase [Pseudoalteromonas sp. SMS1]|uniref:GNAT family N-acetyltransferase n=1 Tax=Pseudoalteromonas sp. SMS1 TaxID=2908894 RepID=UPI001F16A107|nr:GNAT family N-acetyltransferase [Pseudoalteromonas sp. SMS1]MCF2857749.1 GNAT family N-acetyltransferase [Pseudoalteromonas sp. SMS1]